MKIWKLSESIQKNIKSSTILTSGGDTADAWGPVVFLVFFLHIHMYMCFVVTVTIVYVFL